MWPSLGILLFSVIVISLQLPKLIKKGLKKEAVLFTAMMAGATLLGIAFLLHVHLPNPLNLLVRIYKPLSRIIISPNQ